MITIWRVTRSILCDAATAPQYGRHRKVAFAAILIGCTMSFCALAGFGPMGTQHDFSSLAWSRGMMCSPCHAPQGGWNHRLSNRTYTISTSPTLDATDLGQPRGVSAKCLGCHDGTVPLDSFGGVAGRTYIAPSKRIGPDLRSHHAVSFTYNAALAARDGGLRNPTTAPSGLGGTIAKDLLIGGKLECNSCHDEHCTDFLIPINGGALCNTCHKQGGGSAGHHMPGRGDPWNNCTLCHGPDLMGDPHARVPTPACTSCHNDFGFPDPPPRGHHFPGREDPWGVCTLCHGGDLKGNPGFPPNGVPSCFTCHGQMWPNEPPPNLAPIADPTGPYEGAPGEPVRFNGSGSVDDGAIISYAWDFGDGLSGSGVSPTHAYIIPGQYTVALTVTDDGGLTDTATTTAEITANLPPIVVTGGPYQGRVDQPVNFDLSGTTDPDGDNLIYVWMDWGDDSGLGFPPPIGPAASHTYTDPGQYTVQFSLTDGHHPATVHEIEVTITDGAVDPPPLGDSTWVVQIPFLFTEFSATFRDIGGVYFVETTYPDGQTDAGIGMEAGGIIFWAHLSGDMYFGNIDHEAGTASGIMFGGSGSGSVWFAQQM